MSSHSDMLVAEVGNSTIKWSKVLDGALVKPDKLPLDDVSVWQSQLLLRNFSNPSRWLLAGSNPPAMEKLNSWLMQHGHQVRIIDHYSQIPITIAVDFPEQVGHDRLLNALAVKKHPAIIVSAGTAITVDAVSAQGHFLGGGILPGWRLMAHALHTQTAQLPQVELSFPVPKMPGKNTLAALQIGVAHCVLDGITGCCRDLLQVEGDQIPVYLTGGDSELLGPALPFPTLHSPHLTLKGLLIVSQSLWP